MNGEGTGENLMRQDYKASTREVGEYKVSGEGGDYKAEKLDMSKSESPKLHEARKAGEHLKMTEERAKELAQAREELEKLN